MRLSTNNIAHINEFRFKGGKISLSVMLKDYNICNARFYECYHDYIDIPLCVLKFMETHKKEEVKVDTINQVTQYQYK